MIQARLFINRIQRRNLARVSRELWVEVTKIKRWWEKDINRIATYRCLELMIIIDKATSLGIKDILAIRTLVILVLTWIILLKDQKCKVFQDLMLEEEVVHLSPRRRPRTISSQLKLLRTLITITTSSIILRLRLRILKCSVGISSKLSNIMVVQALKARSKDSMVM